jgi:uncharacterized membrane protein
VNIKDTGFIKNTNNYTYDFILFPSSSNATVLLPSIEESEEAIEAASVKKNVWPLVISTILVLLLLFFLHSQRKKTTKKSPVEEMSADLESILHVIKAEGGRTTQKVLRKHIPCSEAKLSMMLTELEAKGKVQKIKKGRGNLVILK